MKDRRKREVVTWSRFFCFTLFIVFSCVFLNSFTFSSFRPFGERFRPVLIPSWRNQAMESISDDSATSGNIEIKETVIFPDQVLFFLNNPPSSSLLTTDDLHCAYFPHNSSGSQLNHPALWIDTQNPSHQIILCPDSPRGFTATIVLKSTGHLLPAPTPHNWDYLAYKAIIDRDNTTLVFVKGLRLRPGRLADAARYECVYGWDFKKPKLMLTTEVITAAQEIIRCRTPLSVLRGSNTSIKVSVRDTHWGIVNSIATPDHRLEPDTEVGKKYDMCVCTMVRNQAKFVREWVMYHARIGVQRWFVYDNNSDDTIDEVIESLKGSGYNITRYVWPWVKTQEAGFAHCALQARGSCEWVGFIDVDEFLHFPSGASLHNVLQSQSTNQVGEVRIDCHTFGPSGLKKVPSQGVSVGYTCRLASPERHKSIVRPEALNSSLINVVHHFHIREDFESVNADKTVMVINHYKYQVWEVFKEKFYRRVATYVADWQNEQNVGSRDRAPGLGTRAVEPENWSSRFCEVTDTGLREEVLRTFTDQHRKRLPWQEEDD